ncbi:MAG: DUF4241 domain-containing protein [Trebonia sp.]
MYLPDLGRLLAAGATYPDGDAEYVLEAHPGGAVVLATGEVVGCDPLTFPEPEPFTVTVPPGTYPLRVWVAVLRSGGAEWRRYVAALQLVIRDEPAGRWEPAVIAGQDASGLDEDGYYGYPADAGAATLADVAAIAGIAEWEYERIEAAFIPAEFPDAPIPGGALSAVTDEETGANIVAVVSGLGDGQYPTFIGYTAADEVASIVTDFMVLPRD